jgi:RES domain-containing protein
LIVWRISNHAALDGGGGLRAAGRWHSRGRPVVYCADSPAAALLEILVHLEIDLEDLPVRYRLLRIELPDGIAAERLDPAALPEGWKEDVMLTRRLGDAWLLSRRTARLDVPSAIVPETWNILLNPAHPDAARARVVAMGEHLLDPRLV